MTTKPQAGQTCCMCFRKHREGSKALAECQASYVMMYGGRTEAPKPEATPEADAPNRQLWTQTTAPGGLYAKRWESPNGRWVIERRAGTFHLLDHSMPEGSRFVAGFGLLSDAMTVAEETEATDAERAPNIPDYQLREAINRAHNTLTEALDTIPEAMSGAGDYAYTTGALMARIKSALIDLEVYGGAGR